MQADDFFAAVEHKAVMRSAYFRAHYGMNVRLLTLAEAQAIPREGRKALCPKCGKLALISGDHAVCNPCRTAAAEARKAERRNLAAVSAG